MSYNFVLEEKQLANHQKESKVYPSAYANAYASRICAGKIKDPSGVNKKRFLEDVNLLQKVDQYTKDKKGMTPDS